MGVEVVLLGNAQDGGMPQAGCGCANCRRATRDPGLRAAVVSLGILDRGAEQFWIIDATPDFPAQLQHMRDIAPDCRLAGIVLTHAHVGHYTGLAHLGREIMDVRGLPLYATHELATFLGGNAPWSQLIDLGNVAVRLLVPGESRALSERLRIVPHAVPHRAEFSDTVAIMIEAGSRAFYCPDIDRWESWQHDVGEFLAGVDVAFLDATFFSADELPGRDMSVIPHPVVTDTVARVCGIACQVVLVHLNHTNPLHGDGPERDWVRAQGVEIGRTGRCWTLGGQDSR